MSAKELAQEKQRQDARERETNIKEGTVRLDRRSAQGVKGAPKKSGQGGKFTWNGPLDGTHEEDAPVALDKNDPNYDEEEKDDTAAVPAQKVEPPVDEKVSIA